MGNNLRPTGKSLNCPICGDHSGKCRISQDENLVLCLSSAGDDWQVSGFKSLGASKCGTWQQYRRCDENYDPEIVQRRRDEWQARERERIASLPSLVSRASKINHNLSRGLNQAHLAKLIERGLSREQIAHHGFYSFQGGIAGVVRGLDREPITVAYRLDNPESGGRYRWGKDSHLPGSGDLPVSVNYPHIGSYPTDILYLCEGSIIKPVIASERLQGVVIGFGGGSGSLERIKPQLLEICRCLEPKEIRILPDAGYRTNPQVSRAIDGLIEICKPLAATSLGDWGQSHDKAVGDIDEITEDRLKSLKYCLCTASNPVNDESSTGDTQTRLTALVTVSDVTDETPFDRVIHLPRITKESLKSLNLTDITDLVINVGNDLIANEIKWAIKGFNGLEFRCKKIGGNLRILGSGMTMFFSEYETLCNGQKFTANYRFKLTETDRYLPQDKILDLVEPGTHKLIGIKAPQAAGKTEVSEKIIKAYQHHYTEKTGKFLPVFSTSLRGTLAEGNSKRLNIPHIDLIVQHGIDWATQGFSNVADSLYLNPKAKKAIFDIDKVDGNCVLFLDEIVQLFDHMLFSSTMKKQRVQVLQNFTELLSKVYNSEHGVVIGLDADLNDTTIQTLSKLMSSGEKADLGLKCLTFKATNKWTKPKRSIHLTEKPEELMSILLDTCKTLEKGEKLLVGTASQQLKSTFSAHWIAQKISEEFPDLKVLVLDSATTKNPDSKAFGGVGKINQMIVENDVIIYTPVLSTGVSIDALPIIESVKSVFSFGSQAINPQTQRQSLERLRSYCDVFAFAPKTITPRILNGATNAWSINQHIIEQNKLNEHDAGIGKNDKKQAPTWAIVKDCRIADKKHAEFGEGSPWMEIFSEYAAYKNLSQKHYQQLFINALKADGYAVKYLEVEGAKALKKEMEAMKEAGLADKYKRIPSDSVECLDLEKYNDLKDAKQLTQAQQDALEKFQVSRTYYLEPNELTPTLLCEHDEYGSAGALTWCYARSLYLGAGHVIKNRDQRKRAQRTERDGVVFLPDSNRELVSAKAAILHEIDLLGFIDRTKDEQIHKKHTEVLALMDRLKARLKRFNTALGKRYTVKSLADPIRVIRELLKAVQHQIVSGVRTMIEGEQVRCYSIEQLGTIHLRDLYMRWAWFECETQVKHEAYIESLETAQEFEDHAIAFTVDNSPHKVVYRYPA